MRPSALVSSVALAVASVSHADIFQYADCDGDGSLLLTELDAEPFADLSGLYLECADLLGENLYQANLSGANLTNANLRGATLYGSDLSGANLVFTNLLDAILVGANLSGANLMAANLTGADLIAANLTGADLIAANLTGADLTGVQSGGIVGTPDVLPAEWSLKSGYLIGPGANLSSANLSGVDLTNTNLSGANLTNANLSGANLTNADLSFANLSGANLSGAILSGANLSFAINVVCPVTESTGSCCTNSGCASISESNCSAMGGTWTEGGSCDDCEPAADDCPADVDGDGSIGFSDVLVILNDWGVCP